SSRSGRTRSHCARAPEPEISSANSPRPTSARRVWRSRSTRRLSSMSQTPDFVLGDEFARVLTETTQALVCVLDRDGRILLFNEACERATGFGRDEVVGRDARDFVIPREEAEAFADVLAYVWKTGLTSPQVGHWLTKDGGRRHEGEAAATMVGGHDRDEVGAVEVGDRILADENTAIGRARDTSLPARIDDYFRISTEVAKTMLRVGYRSTVAAPIFVAGVP